MDPAIRASEFAFQLFWGRQLIPSTSRYRILYHELVRTVGTGIPEICLICLEYEGLEPTFSEPT
jgi:hypothetical protein